MSIQIEYNETLFSCEPSVYFCSYYKLKSKKKLIDIFLKETSTQKAIINNLIYLISVKGGNATL